MASPREGAKTRPRDESSLARRPFSAPAALQRPPVALICSVSHVAPATTVATSRSAILARVRPVRTANRRAASCQSRHAESGPVRARGGGRAAPRRADRRRARRRRRRPSSPLAHSSDLGYGPTMRPWILALGLALGLTPACQPPQAGSTQFTTTAVVLTSVSASTGEAPGTTAEAPASSSTTPGDLATGDLATDPASGDSGGTTLILDVGADHDLGDGNPDRLQRQDRLPVRDLAPGRHGGLPDPAPRGLPSVHRHHRGQVRRLRLSHHGGRRRRDLGRQHLRRAVPGAVRPQLSLRLYPDLLRHEDGRRHRVPGRRRRGQQALRHRRRPPLHGHRTG
jgi:hypothetical protein